MRTHHDQVDSLFLRISHHRHGRFGDLLLFIVCDTRSFERASRSSGGELEVVFEVAFCGFEAKFFDDGVEQRGICVKQRHFRWLGQLASLIDHKVERARAAWTAVDCNEDFHGALPSGRRIGCHQMDRVSLRVSSWRQVVHQRVACSHYCTLHNIHYTRFRLPSDRAWACTDSRHATRRRAMSLLKHGFASVCHRDVVCTILRESFATWTAE